MCGLLNKKKQGPISLFLTAIILGLVFGSMVYTAVSEPDAVVNQENLKISTFMYGVTQSLKDVKDIKLSNDVPPVTYKSNGIGLGSIDRGWFTVSNMGKGRLYIHTDCKPFIYIMTKDSFIIINYKDAARTQNLYDELMKNWKVQ